MKRKNLLLSVLIVTLSVVMSACSGSSNLPGSPTGTNGTAGDKGKKGLSKVNMLLVGTLKLDSTDQAVTAEEAVKLLPLWQAYRSVSTSQTAAEAEVDALLNQIESTMTTEQMKAIEAMNLTNTDIVSLMQSMGGGMGSQGTPNPQSTPNANFSSSGILAGNPPSGSAGGPPSGGRPSGGGAIMVGLGGDAGSAAGLGGGPMLQGTQDPSMQATAQARFSTQANKVNTILLDMLISKLQAKTSQK